MKDKYSIDQQIQLFKDNGISFNLMDEAEAKLFLENNSYFFKLKSYTKNYDKNATTGKYNGLEFAYLVELSTLDTHFRNWVMDLSLSIEHQLKVMLMRDITRNDAEDGYSLIQEFFQYNKKVKYDIENSRIFDSKELIEKYSPDIPVWVFLEVATFGNFLKLFKYYYRKYPDRRTLEITNLAYAAKFLRNAAAHNNCLFNSLRMPYKRGERMKENRQLKSYLRRNGFSRTQVSMLSNPLIHDFASSLRLFSLVCRSQRMYRAVLEDAVDLFHNRFVRHHEYFDRHVIIMNHYNMGCALIEHFQSVECCQ